MKKIQKEVQGKYFFTLREWAEYMICWVLTVLFSITILGYVSNYEDSLVPVIGIGLTLFGFVYTIISSKRF